MDEDIDDIPYVDSSLYAWPAVSEDQDEYSHITNYKIFDERNELVELLDCGADELPSGGVRKNYRAVGTLVPPQGSTKNRKRTQFSVLNYALDFGDDENRGFWLSDKYDVWYKLEEPAQEYASHAAKALRFSAEFFKLMDSMLKPDKNGVSHCFQQGQLYSCNKSVEYFYMASGQSFDLSVLTEDNTLLYRRLVALFVPDCALLKSLRPVSGVLNSSRTDYIILCVFFLIQPDTAVKSPVRENSKAKSTCTNSTLHSLYTLSNVSCSQEGRVFKQEQRKGLARTRSKTKDQYRA